MEFDTSTVKTYFCVLTVTKAKLIYFVSCTFEFEFSLWMMGKPYFYTFLIIFQSAHFF